MDRYAIFVDVGYVLASVADLITGSPERNRVNCDFGALVDSLASESGRGTSLPLLRTYWYDASLSGQPEHDQEKVAELQGVRLRLGRLVRREQKGVDSRIVRDLIVLARDSAIAEAYVLAGDEDLCEGVEEAQDHGVRIVLVGVPGVNQSRLLMQQADQHQVLPEAFWRRHFSAREDGLLAVTAAPVPAGRLPILAPMPPAPAPVAGFNPVMQAAFAAAVRSAPASATGRLAGTVTVESDAFEKAASDAGREFAKELLKDATPVDLDHLRSLTGWQVPTDLDVRLLRFADQVLGGYLWERPELKRTVRTGFWEEFRSTAPSKRPD
jgi:hypothetical protein